MGHPEKNIYSSWGENFLGLEDLRTAVDASALGIWDYRPVTGDLYWSSRAKELAGMTRDSQITYDLFLRSLHPEDKSLVQERIAKALSLESDGVYHIEYRAIGIDDNVERWLSARGRVFFAEDCRPTRFIGTVLDISALKKSELALKQMAGRLARSNQELEGFASILAHDLKEPLRMVTSFLKLLWEKGLIAAEGRDFFDFAVKGANQMKALIDALHEYSLVDRQGLTFSTVDCAEIVKNVLLSLSPLLEDAMAEVTYADLPHVRGDHALLSLVFQNLISNSVKFRGDAKPKVHVSADRSEGEFVFRVRDNGIGFPMECQNRIFVLFQRLCGPDDKMRGTGLATCKRVVERHGGRIWAESSPGNGATFYFTLPCE